MKENYKPCAAKSILKVFGELTSQKPLAVFYCKLRPHFQVLFSSTNQLHFGMSTQGVMKITFNTTEVLLNNHIPVKMQSATSGYLTSPGFDGIHYRPDYLNISHTLTSPAGHHAIMVSFEHLLVPSSACSMKFYVTLTVSENTHTNSTQMHLCTQRSALVFVAHEVRLT